MQWTGVIGGTRGTMKIGDTNPFGLCGRGNDVRKICDEAQNTRLVMVQKGIGRARTKHAMYV